MISEGGHKAFKEQEINKNNWCSLYKNRKG